MGCDYSASYFTYAAQPEGRSRFASVIQMLQVVMHSRPWRIGRTAVRKSEPQSVRVGALQVGWDLVPPTPPPLTHTDGKQCGTTDLGPAAPGHLFWPLWTGAQNFPPVPPSFEGNSKGGSYPPDLCVLKTL